MASDFANSWEQRKWQYACNSHARACEAIAKIGECGRTSDTIEKALAFWRERKAESEREFPCLAKSIIATAQSNAVT